MTMRTTFFPMAAALALSLVCAIALVSHLEKSDNNKSILGDALGRFHGVGDDMTADRIQEIQQQQHRRNIVGGYFKADLRDGSVTEAASFVFGVLTESDSPPGGYSFSVSSNTNSYKVLEASQQVVAGKNLKLTVAVTDSSQHCVGAFTVTVWDHFGEMSVTKWGEEVSCDEAEALMHQEDFINAQEQEEETGSSG